MFASILDDPTLLYTVLAIIGLVFATRWWSARTRAPLIGVAVVAVLAVLLWVLSTVIVTDSRAISNELYDMASAVETKDINRIFADVSSQFSARGMGKDSFRQRVEGYLQHHEVHGIRIWDYEVNQLSRAERKATVTFKVKANGIADSEGVNFFTCRSTFVLDPDGRWRLSNFLLFSPITDPNKGEPFPLP